MLAAFGRSPHSAGAAVNPAPASPEPVAAPHFPDRLHAFIWRNWPLVPTARLAAMLGAAPGQVVALGKSMGLPDPPAISDDQWRRSYITIIRRNWHLLSMDQLGGLLGWTPEQLAFTLREDDFLAIKLGPKPRCEPLAYGPPTTGTQARAREIARVVRDAFHDLDAPPADPLFGFVRQLSQPPTSISPLAEKSRFSPRFCYSYFALYGDPLLESEADPFSPPSACVSGLSGSFRLTRPDTLTWHWKMRYGLTTSGAHDHSFSLIRSRPSSTWMNSTPSAKAFQKPLSPPNS